MLLLSPNRTVSRDRLIDAVWEEAPPATALRQLQNCISYLRHHLPAADRGKQVITASPSGYRINVETDELDATLFRSMIAEARQLRAADDNAGATATFREALGLWQGPALAGLSGGVIEAGSACLNEQRLAALEDHLGLRLDGGQHHEVVGELIELVAANPLREHMVGLLMRALYGSGRQGEALRAYEQMRRRLADDLGLDPGPRLKELHASILRNTLPEPQPAAIDRPDPAPLGYPAPRQLPAPVRHFVGRSAAIEDLNRLADAVDEESVPIAVIDGTGGIGKTALAVRWAHRVAPRFPDGQLFANLRGFDPTQEAMSPSEAIRGFLHAFGIPAERIPVSLDEQVNMYRTFLAERRVLIVLDNARDVDQVRPLLPGGSGCFVIVTSRNELTGLVATEGARPLTLGMLTAAEARDLLASHLGARRVEAGARAVDELVARCAGLPLALAIIAARAAAHPTFSLSTFAAELANARRRLDAVDGGDQHSQVRSVFSWSYQRLPTQAARLFRLLGLQRGADITVPAAANLAGVPANQARQLLAELARAHLVTEHKMGRYSLHDLLSAYATEQAHVIDSEQERGLALQRLLGYYLHAAAIADELVNPYRRRTPLPKQPGPHDLPRFDAHAEALAWFATERANLVPAVRLAHERGEYELGWRLASLLWGLFQRAKGWDDWIGTTLIGLACARACGNAGAEFTMLSGLGTAHREHGQLDKAAHCHEQALTVSREIGDRHAEAQALNGLGAVHAEARRMGQARYYLRAALTIRREIGDLWGEAITVCNLGEADLQTGNVESAQASFLAALDIQRRIGDRLGEATALSYLGQSYRAGQCWHEAINCLEEALTIHRELGDQAMEALDRQHLGMTQRSLGQHEQGEAQLRAALATYRRLGMATAAEDVDRLISASPAAVVGV